MTFMPDDVFHLSLAFQTGAAAAPAGRFKLTAHLLMDSERFDDDKATVVVWGSPAIDGKIIGAAQARAYAAVDRIDWPEGFCRRDIGWRAVERERGR